MREGGCIRRSSEAFDDDSAAKQRDELFFSRRNFILNVEGM